MKDNKGHFKPGNKHGNRWQSGQSGNPAGKPKGTVNLMTIVKEIAMTADKKTGRTLFAQTLINATEANKRMRQAVELMSPDDKRYHKAQKDYQEACVQLTDHLVKASGDYVTKVDPGTEGAEKQFSSARFVEGKKIVDLK